MHRKKVNLNSAAEPSNATSLSKPSVNIYDESALTAEPDVPTPGPSGTPSDVDVGTSSRPPLSNGKRKIRSSRGDESSKRSRLAGSSSAIAKEHIPPSVRLSDLGGVEACVEKMLELVAMPLTHPEIYLHIRV